VKLRIIVVIIVVPVCLLLDRGRWTSWGNPSTWDDRTNVRHCESTQRRGSNAAETRRFGVTREADCCVCSSS